MERHVEAVAEEDTVGEHSSPRKNGWPLKQKKKQKHNFIVHSLLETRDSSSSTAILCTFQCYTGIELKKHIDRAHATNETFPCAAQNCQMDDSATV